MMIVNSLIANLLPLFPKSLIKIFANPYLAGETLEEAIAETLLNSSISIKPSHMGLKLDKTFCFDNIREVAGHAAARRIFVRIDMEDTLLKNHTLDLFFRLKKEFDNVGIMVQAYLRSAIQAMPICLNNCFPMAASPALPPTMKNSCLRP